MTNEALTLNENDNNIQFQISEISLKYVTVLIAVLELYNIGATSRDD